MAQGGARRCRGAAGPLGFGFGLGFGLGLGLALELGLGLALALALALGVGLGVGLGSEPDARLRHGAGRSQCGGPCDLPQSHTLHSRPDMPLLRAAMRPVDEAAARLAGRPG